MTLRITEGVDQMSEDKTLQEYYQLAGDAVKEGGPAFSSAMRY